MKRVLQKQKTALKFLASARSSLITETNPSQSVLTEKESEKLFAVLEENFNDVMKSICIGSHPSVDLTDKMHKLWSLILSVRRSEILLREHIRHENKQTTQNIAKIHFAQRINCNKTTSFTQNKNNEYENDSEISHTHTKETELDGNREMFEKEKQHLLREIINLKENVLKSNNNAAELHETERSYKMQIQDLKNRLESQVADTVKELKLRQLHETKVKELQKQMDSKDEELAELLFKYNNAKEQCKLLENVTSEQSLTNELLSQNNSHLLQKILKLQTEYNAQMNLVNDLTQKYVYVSNQMKICDEHSTKITSDLAKTLKLKESLQKRVQVLEDQKSDVANENEKLYNEIQLLKKDIEKWRKMSEREKRYSEELTREKETFVKNLQQLSVVNGEQGRILKIELRAKDQLCSTIDHLNKKESTLNRTIHALQNENENLKSKIIEWKNDYETVKAELTDKESFIKQFKSRLNEMEVNHIRQTCALENVTKEKNKLTEDLIKKKEEIYALNESIKSCKKIIEKEKLNVDLKETELLIEKSVLQKLEEDKEKLYSEIRNHKEIIKHLENRIQSCDQEIHNLSNANTKLESELQKKNKIISQMTSDHELLSSKLMMQSEDIIRLNAKEKLVSLIQEKKELEWKNHAEKMKNLKLAISRLNMDKAVLNRTLSVAADLRSEIFFLEKELTKQRIKCRALEDELQNPLNIHRWRMLEGVDPRSYELINKVLYLQKRTHQQSAIVVKKDLQLKEIQNLHQNLLETTNKLSSSKAIKQLHFFQQQTDNKKKKIKHLLVEIYMYEFHAIENKQELERKEVQLNELKNKYFKQKKILFALKNNKKNSTVPISSPSMLQEALPLNGGILAKSIFPPI